MLSVVVPCYNEAGNIPFLFEKFQPLLIQKPDTEIIFVNNGSTDDSARVFEAEAGKYPGYNFKIYNVEKNQGYGFGILSGLRSSKGDILAWTHADMQTDPEDVLVAFGIYQAKNDPTVLVKGKRKNRKWAEAFFSFGMELIASAALSSSLHDINAQPKLFSRRFFESIEADAPYDFSLDLYFLYHARKQGKIISFPVYFKKRLFGEAKGGGSFKTRIKLINRTFTYIFKLRKNLKAVK